MAIRGAELKKKRTEKSVWFKFAEEKGMDPHKSVWANYAEKKIPSSGSKQKLPQIRFCTQCGDQLSPESRFCERCGFHIKK
ncbi:MAG: zinc-ribbon domain-containing protein [Candidatus Hodarchaeales archaeon]